MLLPCDVLNMGPDGCGVDIGLLILELRYAGHPRLRWRPLDERDYRSLCESCDGWHPSAPIAPIIGRLASRIDHAGITVDGDAAFVAFLHRGIHIESIHGRRS
jgi:hypothetical protein